MVTLKAFENIYLFLFLLLFFFFCCVYTLMWVHYPCMSMYLIYMMSIDEYVLSHSVVYRLINVVEEMKIDYWSVAPICHRWTLLLPGYNTHNIQINILLHYSFYIPPPYSFPSIFLLLLDNFYIFWIFSKISILLIFSTLYSITIEL